MKNAELMALCAQGDPDAEVAIGMWHGPGSPAYETFEIIDHRREVGRLVLCGHDKSRVEHATTPSKARESAARELENLSSRLRRQAQAIREGFGAEDGTGEKP